MFNVGDHVKVREDATDTKKLYFSKEMDKYRNNIYEIKEVEVDECQNWYYLNGCYHNYGYWIFDESWLEPYEEDVVEIEETEIEDLLCLM